MRKTIYSKVAIIGSSGQLGSELADVFGENAIPFGHEDLEVKDIQSCRSVLKGADAAINCSGYVAVDKCETHPDEAFAVNAVGARNVALVCSELNIPCIFISTDFVFDGKSKKPYTEDDAPNPINTYGLSKYAGEIFTKNLCLKHYIIRTSGIYGKTGARGKGGNFVDWMLAKEANKEELAVVDDLVTSPTYARDVAIAIKAILSENIPFGIYHAVNSGHCTWLDFARKIFELSGIDATVLPIKSGSLKRDAKRPVFSALDNKKLFGFGISMRAWDAALKEYLNEKKIKGK